MRYNKCSCLSASCFSNPQPRFAQKGALPVLLWLSWRESLLSWKNTHQPLRRQTLSPVQTLDFWSFCKLPKREKQNSTKKLSFSLSAGVGHPRFPLPHLLNIVGKKLMTKIFCPSTVTGCRGQFSPCSYWVPAVSCLWVRKERARLVPSSDPKRTSICPWPHPRPCTKAFNP